jgi:hypothetical protein
MNPEMVQSKLGIKYGMPASPLLTTPRQTRTPNNVTEVAAQSAWIMKRIKNHASFISTSIVELRQQFEKGA